MSWIRLVRDENPAGSYNATPAYDGVCEESADLTAEQNNGWVEYGGGRKILGVGSMILCLRTGTCSIKCSNGSWAEIGGGGGSAAGQETASGSIKISDGRRTEIGRGVDSSAAPQNDAKEAAG